MTPSRRPGCASQRSDVADVDNLPAWLTTVVSRICLDQLRSRTARREDLGADLASPGATRCATSRSWTRRSRSSAPTPSVALCSSSSTPSLQPSGWPSVCTTCSGCPSTRSRATLGRSSTACRQLASRARRRVRGQDAAVEVDRARHHEVVEAFLDASRNGRFDRLVALLHPDAEVAADAAAVAMGSPALLRGADEVAQFYNGRARAARPHRARRLRRGPVVAAGRGQGGLRLHRGRRADPEIELLAGELDRLDLGAGTVPHQRD